jgi:hypothetical protein
MEKKWICYCLRRKRDGREVDLIMIETEVIVFKTEERRKRGERDTD